MRIKVNWFVRLVAKLARVDLEKIAVPEEPEQEPNTVTVTVSGIGSPLEYYRKHPEEAQDIVERATGVNSPLMGRTIPQAAQGNEVAFVAGPMEYDDMVAQGRNAALEEINRQYAIPQELWDNFRTEEQMGNYYREQLEDYVLKQAQGYAPPGVSAREYTAVAEEALRRMSNVETPPRIHWSHEKDRLVISPPRPDISAYLDGDNCEIPEEMFD